MPFTVGNTNHLESAINCLEHAIKYEMNLTKDGHLNFRTNAKIGVPN
jgi:hypothetical protein